ncbi:hypothetical protein [Nostoc sp.]|uniref:hypothetical protein n=1 Tax=Nostoc sp. TaxID=1180 RepID=UPI002FF4FDA9
MNQQQQKYIDLLLKFKQEYQIYFGQICRQLVLNWEQRDFVRSDEKGAIAKTSLDIAIAIMVRT